MDVPLNIRSLIIQQHRGGMTSRQIAKTLSVCKSTVNNLIKRFHKTGTVKPTRIGKCGRHRILTERDERGLRRASVANPTLTARELRTSVAGNVSQVSISTIKRTLIRRGRFSYRPRKCPALTSAQMRVRLKWCRENRNRTEDYWKKVIKFLCFTNLTPLFMAIFFVRPYFLTKHMLMCVEHKHDSSDEALIHQSG